VAGNEANDPGAPWYLTSPDQLRLGPGPSAKSAKTTQELRELRTFQRSRTARQVKIIKRWNRGPATVAWTKLMLKMIRDHQPRPAISARGLALLHTGMLDALVAAADTRQAYRDGARPKPGALDDRIHPVLGKKRGTSDVPVRVAIGATADEVLKYLFPNEPDRTFDDALDELADSRLWGGMNYRSDNARARSLGEGVAALVLDRAAHDGFTNTTPAHPRINDEAHWSPTAPSYTDPPIGGPVGTWQTWILDSPDQLRSLLPGPSAYGSDAFMDNLLEVKQVQDNLTQDQKDTAFFWDDGAGTLTPPGHWFQIALEQFDQYHVSTKQAARISALLGATEADAAIAFFEAKFYWWAIRPITAMWRLCDGDTTLCTEQEASSNPARAPYYGNWFPLIVTPGFPAYPGGHSTFSGSAGRVLTHFFPQSGDTLNQLANDAAMSRLFGGIHFREDNDAGLVLGRALADLAIERDGGGTTGP
jgi:hypothetical protein